jgi:hypothetical protein
MCDKNDSNIKKTSKKTEIDHGTSSDGTNRNHQSDTNMYNNPNNEHLAPIILNSSTRSKKIKNLVNNEYCSYCDEGGDLLNCDRCPASFHFMCHEPPLDLNKIPKGEFICNKCRSKAASILSLERQISSIDDAKSQIDKLLNSVPVSSDTKSVNLQVIQNEPSIDTLIR